MIVRPAVLAVLLLVCPCASEARDDVHWIADETIVESGKPLRPPPTAESELAIARFYIKKRDYIGAINRCKVIVTHFTTSHEVEEALALLVESYLALAREDGDATSKIDWRNSLKREAQTAAAVLNRKFPDSDWLRVALERLKSADLKPEEDERSWISRALK
jgi:outer membrane protein assembly factor BamD